MFEVHDDPDRTDVGRCSHRTVCARRTILATGLALYAAVSLGVACGEPSSTSSEPATADSGVPIDPATRCKDVRPVGHDAELKVLTINLRHDEDAWEVRLPLLADEIARLRPDLIGLQEVEIPKRQAERLNELVQERTGEPPYELRQELKPGIGAVTGEGIGVMSRFHVEQSDLVDLTAGRLTLFVRVRTPAGDAVDFFNTHLHAGPEHDIRHEQAKTTTAFMAEKEGCTLTVLTGDMNADDTSPAIQHFLSAKLIDTYEAVHGPEATARDGNTSPVVLRDGGFQQNPKRRIDYVFARPLPPLEGRVTSIDSVVCFENHDENGFYPSDHFGVMTTIKVGF